MEYAEEIRIKGSPVSEGIAIGIVFFLHAEEAVIPTFPITLGELDGEIARYRRALVFSKEELRRLQSDLALEGSSDAVTIIDSHIQMLDDPMITTHMEERIREMMQNTESVFRSVLSDYETRFSETTDVFFQQRLGDVMDLSRRILCHLSPTYSRSVLSEVPFNSILFAKELVPSHIAAANTARISAFVTQAGGGHSHAALIARAKGIPYVTCVDVLDFQECSAKYAIVDGQSGEVIISPRPETLERYKHKKVRLKTSQQLLQKEVQCDAETMDGCLVQVFANIGNVNDLDNLEQTGAEGVGLLRSEYLFFQNRYLFASEEEQYLSYIEMIKKIGKLPLVIRVFDVGGDKQLDFAEIISKEANPVLGCRGIRFLLRHQEIFKIQLRAILRASVHGNVRILLPLISDVSELQQARKLIEEVSKELESLKIPIQRTVPLGCMIEVPSAVLVCDTLAAKSDFLSIGTNDLIQYTLGIDRNNPIMSDMCYPAHPSIVRMIKMVITEAKRHRRSVTICGEIASNPLFIPLLLGLGVDEFSCSPRYIPLVKRAIRQTTILAAYDLAQRVLALHSSTDIAQVLLEAYNQSVQKVELEYK